MKTKLLTATFFTAWFITGCSLETFFEGTGNAIVTVIAVAVAIASVWALNHK